ncbi:MAG: ABC transporter ATP-binding protein [Opitutaceae bacterium]|nr:ABC transporter ATP-binding protein [Opitutaceae bacterium]
MSLPAIEVSGLSKRYVIEHESRHDTLRDTLHHTARKLWRRFRWGTGFQREEFWALKDLSFTVQPGEVVGIIGRNGAGKSTLLKILSRITEPTAGKITLRGRVASLLEVGTGFHPDLTGRENIFLNGAILGMRRAEIRQKFDEIVAFAEVEKFLDTPVKRYSSGMYVRLAFAVAAHLEPEILIVDEVLAVGDAQFQQKCLSKIHNISQGNGRSVLLVSHNLAVIRQLCGRALFLRDGRLFSSGPAPATIEAYLREGITDGVGFSPVVGQGVTLTDLRICRSEDPRPTGHLVFAEPCEIRATFDRGDRNLRITPVIRIHDSMGTLVCTTCGPEEGIDFLPADASHTYVCEIAQLRLMPGRYFVSVAAYSLAATAHLDVQQAIAFEVSPARLSGASRAYRADHGVVRLIDRLRVIKGSSR